MALSNHSNNLSALGEIEQAEKYIREAIDNVVKLSATRADKRPLLTALMANLANYLSIQAKNKSAFRVGARGLRILQELDGEQPDVYRARLAVCLGNVSAMLNALGRHRFALRLAARALEIDKALAELRPTTFLPRVTLSLAGLADRYVGLGMYAEALPYALEALKVQRELSEEHRLASGSQLAHRLLLVAGILSGLGEYGEALENALEALEVNYALRREYPQKHRADIVSAANQVAWLHLRLGRLSEAKHVLGAIEDIVRELKAEGKVNSLERFQYLMVSSEICQQERSLQSGLELVVEACEIVGKSLRYTPQVYREEAATAWALRAVCHEALGEAIHADEAVRQGLGFLDADLRSTPRVLSPAIQQIAENLIRLAGDLAIPLDYPAVLRALGMGNKA